MTEGCIHLRMEEIASHGMINTRPWWHGLACMYVTFWYLSLCAAMPRTSRSKELPFSMHAPG